MDIYVQIVAASVKFIFLRYWERSSALEVLMATASPAKDYEQGKIGQKLHNIRDDVGRKRAINRTRTYLVDGPVKDAETIDYVRS